MKIKENKKLKDINNNKIKRQVSIITVFLWIFLVATIVVVVVGNVKNTNALEENSVEIYEENNEIDANILSTYAVNRQPHTVPINIKFIELDEKLTMGYTYLFDTLKVNLTCIDWGNHSDTSYSHTINLSEIAKEVYKFLETSSNEYDVIGYSKNVSANSWSYQNFYSVSNGSGRISVNRGDYYYIAIKEEEYDEIINIGDENSGNYFWTESIIYHSNSPSGEDKTYKVKYKITSDTNTLDMSDYIKSFKDVGFYSPIGYVLRSKWYDKPSGLSNEVTQIIFKSTNPYSGRIHNLYAHYRGDDLPHDEVVLNYYDRDKFYSKETHNKGYICNIITCDNIREGYEFVGWSDKKYSNEVVYKSGNNLTLNYDTNLYAVWKPLNGMKIKAEKIWEDEDNKYEKRPGSVILQIKNGEEIVSEMSVSEENNWSCEFEVAKYDSDGNEIEYTIDEKETDVNYEKIIDGYKVINKYRVEENNKNEENNNNDIIKNEENVDTSDINIWMYVGIVVISIIVIAIIVLIVRRNNR